MSATSQTQGGRDQEAEGWRQAQLSAVFLCRLCDSCGFSFLRNLALSLPIATSCSPDLSPLPLSSVPYHISQKWNTRGMGIGGAGGKARFSLCDPPGPKVPWGQFSRSVLLDGEWGGPGWPLHDLHGPEAGGSSVLWGCPSSLFLIPFFWGLFTL